MRDYGAISPNFWIGSTGKELRGNAGAQLLALYLMTSPHSTSIGIFHCPVLYMGHETGLGMEGASKALTSLIEAGFCTYEEASETVFVHRMAFFQVADEIKPSDKRSGWVQKEYQKIVSPSVKAMFFKIYSKAYGLKNDSPLEAPSKPLPSQEQEQEQDKELPIGNLSSAMPTTIPKIPRIPDCPHAKLIDLFAERLPELPRPKPELWAGASERAMRARWRWLLTAKKANGARYATDEESGVAWMDRFFCYVAKSDFLMGRSGSFQCTLQWLMTEGNFAKVLQGNYDNREAA